MQDSAFTLTDFIRFQPHQPIQPISLFSKPSRTLWAGRPVLQCGTRVAKDKQHMIPKWLVGWYATASSSNWKVTTKCCYSNPGNLSYGWHDNLTIDHIWQSIGNLQPLSLSPLNCLSDAYKAVVSYFDSLGFKSHGFFFFFPILNSSCTGSASMFNLFCVLSIITTTPFPCYIILGL